MKYELKQLCVPESEVRNDYLVDERMKKIWNIELNLASILLDICKKHKLKISVGYGSMIGAVRHKGFVPWDDDMDFVMPRQDFEKLASLTDIEFNNNYSNVKLESYHNDHHYYQLTTLTLRFDGTTAMTKIQSMMGYKYHQGIFIDIFPVDLVPDDPCQRDALVNCLQSNIRTI